jgi:hypothetical protein
MSKLTVKQNASVEQDAIIGQYRELVAQRYTATSIADLDRLLSAPPYFASKKIDGELWFISVESSGVKLFAANKRLAEGDSAIHAAAKDLPVGTVLAGELHVPNKSGRERVGDVAASLAKGGSDLAFAAFDIIAHPEFSWQDSPFASRLEALKSLLGKAEGSLSVVDVKEISNADGIRELYAETVEKSSAEGLIVRCPDGRILKVKPSFDLDLAIIGYTVQNSGSGDEVRSVLLALVDGETFIPVGTSGNAVEGFDRAELFKRLSSITTTSEYRHAASTGQLYQAVKPEVLVECRVLDLQPVDSQGKIIRKPELNNSSSGWTIAGSRPAISLINAVMVRLREDKADVASGARLTQLPENLIQANTASGDIRPSEVIRRQVWTKESKDKVDVRKLLVWKTNKETDPRFPAYVVHWTDYSSSRKAPLAREVKLAMNQKDAEAIAESLIEENVKKGWNEKK